MVHWQYVAICGTTTSSGNTSRTTLHRSGSTTSSVNIARAVLAPVAILHVDDTLLSGNPSHSLPLSYLLLLTREGLWLLTVATVAGHSGHLVAAVAGEWTPCSN